MSQLNPDLQKDDFYRGVPVLVTGASGFVGSHLTKSLLEAGAKVRVLVRENRKVEIVEELKSKGAEVFYGDIRDPDRVSEAIAGMDFVFHIAALFREAKHENEVYYQINVEGVRNVLNGAEAHSVKKVIHCSTVGVHSHITRPPADEHEPYRPGDIYQLTKCEGEKLALERFRFEKLNGVIVRPAMIWGEGDMRMLKLFRGVRNRKFPVIGTGETLTHWVYVHDLVRGFMLAAQGETIPGDIFIIAGQRPVTISELVETVAEVAGVLPLPIKIPARPVQILGSVVEMVCKPLGIEPPIYRRRVDFFTKDRSFDISKAKSKLGYLPAQDFKTEVHNIYHWYKDEGLL